MAEKSAVDVLNTHHTKLNDHTAQLNAHGMTIGDLQKRIDTLDKRLATVEAEHQPMRDFFKRINDWVGALKD